MKTIVLILISLVFGLIIEYIESKLIEEIKSDGCPFTWIKFRSKCYKFVSRSAKDFQTADKMCRSRQANLLMIKDEETKNFILTIPFPKKYSADTRYLSSSDDIPVIWLGIKSVVTRRSKGRQDFNETCQKYWLDGTPVVYHRFIQGYWDYHFGNTNYDNEYYHWFYFFIRISNETRQCREEYIVKLKLKPCIIGEWLVPPGEEHGEAYGVICEKDLIETNSNRSLTGAISFLIVMVIIILQSISLQYQNIIFFIYSRSGYK